jgi:hypothetical protein
MIRIELKNGFVLLFNEWERITTVGWISDDGEYWSGEWRCRADELDSVMNDHGMGTRYVLYGINELGQAVTEKGWLSPVASVRKFVPMEFV